MEHLYQSVKTTWLHILLSLIVVCNGIHRTTTTDSHHYHNGDNPFWNPSLYASILFQSLPCLFTPAFSPKKPLLFPLKFHRRNNKVGIINYFLVSHYKQACVCILGCHMDGWTERDLYIWISKSLINSKVSPWREIRLSKVSPLPSPIIVLLRQLYIQKPSYPTHRTDWHERIDFITYISFSFLENWSSPIFLATPTCYVRPVL